MACCLCKSQLAVYGHNIPSFLNYAIIAYVFLFLFFFFVVVAILKYFLPRAFFFIWIKDKVLGQILKNCITRSQTMNSSSKSMCISMWLCKRVVQFDNSTSGEGCSNFITNPPAQGSNQKNNQNKKNLCYFRGYVIALLNFLRILIN